jgi:hypothetical protein
MARRCGRLRLVESDGEAGTCQCGVLNRYPMETRLRKAFYLSARTFLGRPRPRRSTPGNLGKIPMFQANGGVSVRRVHAARHRSLARWTAGSITRERDVYGGDFLGNASAHRTVLSTRQLGRPHAEGVGTILADRYSVTPFPPAPLGLPGEGLRVGHRRENGGRQPNASSVTSAVAGCGLEVSCPPVG